MKKQVTAPELYSVLDTEFHRLRAVECNRCVTPPPVRAGPTGGEWRIPTPLDCPHKCRELLDQIVERLQQEYELTTSW